MGPEDNSLHSGSKRGDAMTPSLPCAKCGRIDDLETIEPIRTIMGELIEWECPCGINRVVEIHRVPRELVKKAMEADEKANTS